jgi:hypothetical protein
MDLEILNQREEPTFLTERRQEIPYLLEYKIKIFFPDSSSKK